MILLLMFHAPAFDQSCHRELATGFMMIIFVCKTHGYSKLMCFDQAYIQANFNNTFVHCTQKDMPFQL